MLQYLKTKCVPFILLVLSSTIIRATDESSKKSQSSNTNYEDFVWNSKFKCIARCHMTGCKQWVQIFTQIFDQKPNEGNGYLLNDGHTDQLKFLPSIMQLEYSNVLTFEDAYASNNEKFEKLTKFGTPQNGVFKDTVGHFYTESDFILLYDILNKTPAFTLKYISLPKLPEYSSHRTKPKYTADTSLPATFRAELSDYELSGLNYGRLVVTDFDLDPNQLNRQTFLLSSIVPVTSYVVELLRSFEVYVRGKASSSQADILVVTGALFLVNGKSVPPVKWNKTIGYNNIPVPSHLFLSTLRQSNNGSYKLNAFLVPNTYDPQLNASRFIEYDISLPDLERIVGFHLFPRLSCNTLSDTRGQLCNTI